MCIYLLIILLLPEKAERSKWNLNTNYSKLWCKSQSVMQVDRKIFCSKFCCIGQPLKFCCIGQPLNMQSTTVMFWLVLTVNASTVGNNMWYSVNIILNLYYNFISLYWSSSCRAASMDIPDPSRHSSLSFWQVFKATSRILTELLYVGSSWSILISVLIC